MRVRAVWIAALLVLAVVGGGLRVMGSAWGLPAQLSPFEPPMHPDEHEAVAGAAMLYRGPTGLTFNKGGALYVRTAWLVDRGLRSVLELPEVRVVEGGRRNWTGAVPMLRILRGFNVALALATAVLLVWAGARLWGCAEGVVAGALLLVFPLHVLDSHYARPEVFTVFLITAALACAFEVVRTRGAAGRRSLVVGGVCAGLATASMLSGAIAFGALAGAIFESVPGQGRARWAEVLRGLGRLAPAAIAGWLLGNFEALLHPSAFLEGLGVVQSTHQGGHFQVPLRQLTRVAAYAMGAPAALAAYVGVAVLCWRRLPGRFVMLGALSLGVALLARVGGDMMRHLEPLVPALACGAAVALVAAARSVAQRGLSRPVAFALIPGGVWLLTLQLSAGYVWPLHAGEDPRYRTGRWLLDNAAPGSTVGRTASYFDDWTFEPRLPDRHSLRVAPLMLRAGFDASPYLDLGLDYLVTSDYARSHASTASARAFHRQLERSGDYREVARFEPISGPWSLPRAAGLLRPSDLLYVTSGFSVYQRISEKPRHPNGN